MVIDRNRGRDFTKRRMEDEIERPRYGIWKFLLGLISAFFVGAILTNFLIMPLLTRSGKVIVMPNLIGMEEKEAVAVLRGKGLEIGEKRWAFSLKYPEGVVIAQNPRFGIKTKRGRIVEITLSKGRGKTVVPDFKGKSLAELLSAINLAGLEARVETTYGDEEGEIIALLPAPGTILDKGSVVKILIGQKESFVVMPRIIGRTLSEANRILDSLGLIIGEVREREGEEEEGRIIFQYPEEEMRVKIGEKVVIVLAKKPSR